MTTENLFDEKYEIMVKDLQSFLERVLMSLKKLSVSGNISVEHFMVFRDHLLEIFYSMCDGLSENNDVLNIKPVFLDLYINMCEEMYTFFIETNQSEIEEYLGLTRLSNKKKVEKNLKSDEISQINTQKDLKNDKKQENLQINSKSKVVRNTIVESLVGFVDLLAEVALPSKNQSNQKLNEKVDETEKESSSAQTLSPHPEPGLVIDFLIDKLVFSFRLVLLRKEKIKVARRMRSFLDLEKQLLKDLLIRKGVIPKSYELKRYED